jgi:hypothetical protein
MQALGRRNAHTNRRALIRYVSGWLAAGVAVALLVVVVLRQADDEPRRRPAADPLARVTASGCVLEDPRGKPADVSRPPVAGPPSRPVADGVYTRPVSRRRLIGALRRGVVVIQYERRLPATDVARLRAAFSSPAPRRIVAPDATGMPFKVAGTAWGRVIGCSKLDPSVLQALQRFAERYAGRGPDN